ncbi:MAG: hypothetical protein AABZ39_12790, partial [Spirochaetota bacterium]
MGKIFCIICIGALAASAHARTTTITFDDDSYLNLFEATGNGAVSATADPRDVIEGKRSLVI